MLYEEEARHRIIRLAGLLEEDPSQVFAYHGHGPPHSAREACIAAARTVAARHNDVGVGAACHLQHLAHLLGRVLQVRVHHTGVLARAREQLHTRRTSRMRPSCSARACITSGVSSVESSTKTTL